MGVFTFFSLFLLSELPRLHKQPHWLCDMFYLKRGGIFLLKRSSQLVLNPKLGILCQSTATGMAVGLKEDLMEVEVGLGIFYAPIS